MLDLQIKYKIIDPNEILIMGHVTIGLYELMLDQIYKMRQYFSS